MKGKTSSVSSGSFGSQMMGVILRGGRSYHQPVSSRGENGAGSAIGFATKVPLCWWGCPIWFGLLCPFDWSDHMAMDQSLEIPFIGMNIHLPAILVFTMGIGFWPISIWFSVCFLCFAYLFFFGFWGVPLILMPTFLLWLWIKTLVHAVKRSHSYWPTDASSRISHRCSVYQTCTNTSPRMITPLSNWLVMFFSAMG